MYDVFDAPQCPRTCSWHGASEGQSLASLLTEAAIVSCVHQRGKGHCQKKKAMHVNIQDCSQRLPPSVPCLLSTAPSWTHMVHGGYMLVGLTLQHMPLCPRKLLHNQEMISPGDAPGCGMM